MPEWKIKLKGDEADLERISLLTFNEFEIKRDNDGYYLASAELNNITDPHKVIDAATAVVDRLNGVRIVRFGESEKIRISALQQSEVNKPPKQYILPKGIRTSAAFGEVNIFVSNHNDAGSARPHFLEKWMEIASNNENVKIALELYGSQEHNWKNLYMVVEKIEDDVGSKSSLKKLGWISTNRLVLFKRTANTFRAIGPAARHSTSRFKPPKKPMDIEEAKSLVRDLLCNWIKSQY